MIRSITELDKVAASIANRLSSELKPNKILKNQVTLLEIIDFEEEKLEKLGYCDYELAYVSFILIELLGKILPTSQNEVVDGINKIYDKKKPIRKTIEEKLVLLNGSNGNTALNLDLEDELLQRFKKLNNGSLAIGKSSKTASLKQQHGIEENPNGAGAGAAQDKDDPNYFDQYKYSSSIPAEQLNRLLQGSLAKSLLLIDYRSKKEFDYNHINYDDVINIDPAWMQGLPEDSTDIDFDQRLQMLMQDEHYLKFRKRSSYELIVIYNLKFGSSQDKLIALEQSLKDNSDVNGIPSASPFKKFIEIITFKCKYLSSRLKRYPVYLGGGVSHWYQVYGENSISKTKIAAPINPPTISVPKGYNITTRPVALNEIGNTNGSTSFDESNNSPYLKNFNDYINTAASTSTEETSVPRNLEQSARIHRETIDITNSPTLPPKLRVSSNIPSSTSSVQQSSPSKTLFPPGFFGSFSCGLVNLGNSCYMNCVLQCLAATPRLTQFFFNSDGVSYRQHINVNNSLGTKGIITTNFVQLLTQMFAYNGKSFSPLNFKRVVGSLSPNKEFATSNQQDCIEFLNFILDGLHEDLNQMAIYNTKEKQSINELTEEQEKTRELLPIRLASTIEWERYLKLNFSVVVDYFQGQYLSRLECLECKLTSTTYNAFSILSVPIPSNKKDLTLDDCLKEFVTKEVLDDANKWHCPRCKKFTRSTKKISITRLPQILIIHFKRFRISSTGYFDKVNSFIKYPVSSVLDLTSYWPSIGTSLGTEEMDSVKEQQILNTLPTRNQIPPFRYKLYGVVNHFGTLSTGHYTSYVYKNSDSKRKREWCYFDDDKVTYNCKESQVSNANAYCLFYERVSV